MYLRYGVLWWMGVPKMRMAPAALHNNKQNRGPMNATITGLRKLGYRVDKWLMLTERGTTEIHLQITNPFPGPAQGATVYVSERATLDEALERMAEKVAEFERK